MSIKKKVLALSTAIGLMVSIGSQTTILYASTNISPEIEKSVINDTKKDNPKKESSKKIEAEKKSLKQEYSAKGDFTPYYVSPIPLVLNSTVDGTIKDESQCVEYLFKPTINCTVEFYVEGSPSTADYDLFIYDENHNRLTRATTSFNHETIVMSMNANQTYFVEVFAAGYGPEYNYTLDVTKCKDFEPNDTLGTAYGSATFYDTYYIDTIATQSDIDFYCFSTLPKGAYSVQLRDIPAGMDYDIRLYNASGSLIGSSTNSNNEDEFIDFNATGLGGIYYVKIYSYSGSNTSTPYRFVIRKQ